MREQELNFTRHAFMRMQQMERTQQEVLDCVRFSEQSYTQTNYRKNQTVYQRGDLAVVVASDGNIITVLHRTQQVYQR